MPHPPTQQRPAKKKAVPKLTAEQRLRAKEAAVMDGTVKNAANWHYLAVRKLSTPNLDQALHGKVESDCSKGCANVDFLAGALDPGNDNWQGNSTSMFHASEHITKNQLQVGDNIVLGDEGRLHALKVRKVATDPVCWSMGSEAGPLWENLSASVAYHQARFHDGEVVTYLRLRLPT